MDIVMDILIASALLVNIVILGIIVYQTIISRKSLDATKQSIEDAKIERQLEVLPECIWIIAVQVELESWKKDLDEKRQQLELALVQKDENTLKELAGKHIKSPKDLGLRRFQYNNMPSWLSRIWMSGAQYYFDAVAPVQCLRTEEGEVRFSLAERVKDRCVESSEAIVTLIKYIQDMVPPVMLNTPASVQDEKFLRD